MAYSIFILVSFSSQPPFAEVLGSELLLMRFSFSPFQGRVLARFFLARLFEYGFQKRCKGVHCVDLGESFQTHIYLQNLASIQPRTRPLKFAASRDVTGHAAEAAAAADAYGGTHVIVCCVPIATSFVVSCSRFLFSETAFSRRSINTKCHALTSISQRCLLCRPEDSFF